MAHDYSRRQAISWALYDWANSAFATTVIAGFFPVFFKQYWSPGVADEVCTFRLGLANSVASIVVAASAPMLGAIADCSGGRKRLLGGFAAVGIGATAALAAVGQGAWIWAAVLFAVGSIGFAAGNIFYDALLVEVAPEQKRHSVSALGYSLGYLGGGLLFALNVAMTLKPAAFGLADAGQAVRVSFVTVAIWWGVFALPLLFWVRDSRPRSAFSWRVAADGFRQVRTTFGHLRRHRAAFTFLIGYFLYIDGVDTVIRMAVDYGMTMGLESKDLIGALLITQFVGFPAALVYGWLGNRIGASRGIYLALLVYLGVTIGAIFMSKPVHFYALAVIIGLVQGGIQALSRSYFSHLIPREKAGEFFGFYNMLGKFAAVLGPLLMGAAALVVGSRFSILSLILLFIAGAIFLARVKEPEVTA